MGVGFGTPDASHTSPSVRSAEPSRTSSAYHDSSVSATNASRSRSANPASANASLARSSHPGSPSPYLSSVNILDASILASSG